MFYGVYLCFIHSVKGEVEKKIYISKNTKSIQYQLKYFKKFGYLLKEEENEEKIINIVK